MPGRLHKVLEDASTMPSARERILICVYGDSLSMPRYSEGLPFFQTYPELVRDVYGRAHPDAIVHLYNRSRGGTAIVTLFEDYLTDTSYFGPGVGDLLIIQCGICDCAPRPIPDWLRRGIGRLPEPLRSPIVRFLHKNRSKILGAGFVWRLTEPTVFAATYHRWLSQAVQDFKRVCAINIAPTTAAMNEHSAGLAHSIEHYNHLIAEAVRSVNASNVSLIDAHRAITSAPCGIAKYINSADGHHITADGHALYGRLITAVDGSPRLLAEGSRVAAEA